MFGALLKQSNSVKTYIGYADLFLKTRNGSFNPTMSSGAKSNSWPKGRRFAPRNGSLRVCNSKRGEHAAEGRDNKSVNRSGYSPRDSTCKLIERLWVIRACS